MEVWVGTLYRQELAELLGGKIRVETELGKGSTFTVSVPCVTYPSGMDSQEKEGRSADFIDDCPVRQ